MPRTIKNENIRNYIREDISVLEKTNNKIETSDSLRNNISGVKNAAIAAPTSQTPFAYIKNFFSSLWNRLVGIKGQSTQPTQSTHSIQQDGTLAPRYAPNSQQYSALSFQVNPEQKASVIAQVQGHEAKELSDKLEPLLDERNKLLSQISTSKGELKSELEGNLISLDKKILAYLSDSTSQSIKANKVTYSTNERARNFDDLPFKEQVTVSSEIQGQRYKDILTADLTGVLIKDKDGHDIRLHANTVHIGGKPAGMRCMYPIDAPEYLENHLRMLAQKQVPLCVVIATPDDMEYKKLPNYFAKNQAIGDCRIKVKRPSESKSTHSATTNSVKCGTLDTERYRMKVDYTDNNNEKVTHTTRFIHVDNWVDKTAVDADSIIALAKETQKAHIASLREQLVSKQINPESDQGKKMLAEMVNNQPLLIHCSAGVGRTGLLMGTIAALNSVKPNETRSALDIANQIVLDMRLSASPTMVQTVEQFAALINAVRAIINEKIINQAIE